MLKERTIFISGIVLAFLPFSGFPILWKKILIALIGLFLSYIAYLQYKEKNLLSTGPKKTETYTENESNINSKPQQWLKRVKLI